MGTRRTRFLVGLASATALLALGLAWAFHPPASMPVPAVGVTLENVTLIEPLRGRTPGRTLVVRADRIT
jgi:hypothetical protein